VDGFGNRNSPRRRSSPEGFVFQPWLRQRPIPSPNRNTSFFLPSPDDLGGVLFLSTHQRQAAHTNMLCWQSANLGQLDVYISKFLDSRRQARRAFPCCPISRQDITNGICWCKVWTLNLISFMAFLKLTTFRMGRAYRTGESGVVVSKQLRHCVRATMPGGKSTNTNLGLNSLTQAAVILLFGSSSNPTEGLKIIAFHGKRHQTRHLHFRFFGC
jgi:hypothetical protein